MITGAKLFAFLGTYLYNEVTYSYKIGLETPAYYHTRYTQEALLNVIDETDLELIIFITDAAYKDNWIQAKNGPGLKSLLDHTGKKYKHIMIPDGKTEEEIWEIFDKVYNEMECDDIIYVDVTNSFRSIPIIFMAVLNYAKVMKKCEIKRILYGAYDARIDNVAPIFDLTPFDRFIVWSSGVEQLTSTGECKVFCSAIENAVSLIAEKQKGKNDELVKLVVNCSKYIEEFYTDLKLVRGRSIHEDGKNLLNVLIEIKKHDKSGYSEFKPLFNLLEKIEKQVAFFDKDDIVGNILECVKLCREFGQYQQAYTMLQENIINYVCAKTGLDCTVYDDRERAGNIIKSRYNEDCEGILTDEEKSIIKSMTEKFINTLNNIAKLHLALGNFRNNLNHAGFSKNRPSKKKFIMKINNFIEKFVLYTEHN